MQALLYEVLVLVVVVINLGTTDGFCGVGLHGHVGPDAEKDVVTVPQLYAGHEGEGPPSAQAAGELHVGASEHEHWHATERHRHLAQTQGYMSVQAAEEAGLTRGIRLQTTWDGITQASASEVCRAAGATITVTKNGEPQSFVCAEKHVVTDAKLQRMQATAAWGEEWFQSALRLNPVADPINITGNVPAGVSLGPYSDADLVVVMTAYPDPAGAISGYAYCIQRDQWQRCTVGAFNWCPESIDDSTSNDVVATERRLVAHEVIHLLEGIKAHAHFVDETGSPRPPSDTFRLQRDAVYDRDVLLVQSPKVVKLAREHFACDQLAGVPLEDHPIGAGAHWESRIMGPEVMSYGTGSGEPYISDLTLAFLEDSGHFRANFSAGGRFVAPSTTRLKAHSLDFLLSVATPDSGPVSGYTPPEPRSPGALRWGLHAGCGFVNGSISDTWQDVAFRSNDNNVQYERYTCGAGDMDGDGRYGCSFENRMSAVCGVKKYDSAHPADATRSCLVDPINGRAEACVANTAPGGQVPRQYDFLGDPAVGGHNSAMDYAPVRIGYWNCLDATIDEGERAMKEETGMSLSFGSFFSGAENDLKKFGGQAHCPECRCFVSSLMEVHRAADPTLPRYGLCYPSNCVTEDRLQVAVKKLGQVYWYGCPRQGGSLFIPGFVGSLWCPPAREFCRFETITGYQYAETSVWLEWVAFGGMILLPLLLIFSLCCCRGSIKHVLCGGAYEVYMHQKKNLNRKDLPIMIGEFFMIMTSIVGLSGSAWCIYEVMASRHESDLKYAPFLVPAWFATVPHSLLGLYGAMTPQARKFWVVLVYWYLGLLLCLYFAAIGVAMLIDPASLDVVIHALTDLAVAQTQDDDTRAKVIGVSLGWWCLGAAICLNLGIAGAMPVLSVEAITESAFSFVSCLLILGAAAVAFLSNYAKNQVETPGDLWFGVGLVDISYILCAVTCVVGLLGLYIVNRTNARSRTHLHLLVALYWAFVIADAAIMGSVLYKYKQWIDHGEHNGTKLDETSKTFGWAYYGSTVLGLVVLACMLVGLTLHVGVKKLMAQASMHLRRLRTASFGGGRRRDAAQDDSLEGTEMSIPQMHAMSQSHLNPALKGATLGYTNPLADVPSRNYQNKGWGRASPDL